MGQRDVDHIQGRCLAMMINMEYELEDDQDHQQEIQTQLLL